MSKNHDSVSILLNKALSDNQLSLNQAVREKFIRYLDLLQTWNRIFNLTSITTSKDMVYLHLLDSLAINPYLQGDYFLDVGSGAGLPGIPLAIVNPLQTWCLMDKNSKKTRFLTQVVSELELPNVTVIHERSERFHLAHHPLKSASGTFSADILYFDTIVARAVGDLKSLIETTEHLLHANGMLIAMKGKYPQDELQDIPNSFVVSDVIRLSIHGIQAQRHLIKIRKR